MVIWFNVYDFTDIIPKLVKHSPNTVLLVVSNPGKRIKARDLHSAYYGHEDLNSSKRDILTVKTSEAC